MFSVVRALVHKFSAHQPGITGVRCLWNQPIILSWSHKSGLVRMWRLDTFEMSNETTLSENIHFMHIVRNDRIYYQAECDVRIFDVNVLYTVFTSLISAIESFKLCSFHRTESVKQQAHQSESKPSHVSERNENETISNHFNVDHDSDQCISLTTLDWRVVCHHEDHSVTGISPVSGIILNIVNPVPEMHNAVVSLDLEKFGKSLYVVYSNGSLLEFNCSVNPAELASMVKPERKQKVYALLF